MRVRVTEEVFEILRRERLDTDERIERAVMHARSIGEVVGLAERMSEAVAAGQAARREAAR